MDTTSQSDQKAVKVDPLFVPDRNLELFDEEKLFQHFKVSNEIRFVSCAKVKFGGERKKIKGKTFFKVWFKDAVFENVYFQDCIFDECWLLGAVFQNCEFHDCQLKNCNTHKVRFDRTYIDPRSFSKLPDKSRYANIGVHLFQELFRNSHEMLQPDFKNSAEYEFRRWQRYELASRWRGAAGRTWRTARRWAGNMFFFMLSGYGLKPSRVVIWFSFFLFFVILFNYATWPCFDFHSGSKLAVEHPTFPLAVYYSVITLSTLGYGDITPQSSFGLLVTSLEAMLGLVWLALLASVLIKKVLR